YFGGRKVAADASGLGRSDLQRHRSLGQPDPSILDAALVGYSRSKTARYRRLLDAPVRDPRAACAFPGLGAELHVLKIVHLLAESLPASLLVQRGQPEHESILGTANRRLYGIRRREISGSSETSDIDI